MVYVINNLMKKCKFYTQMQSYTIVMKVCAVMLNTDTCSKEHKYLLLIQAYILKLQLL